MTYLLGLQCPDCTCGKINTDMTRHPVCLAVGGFQEARYDLPAARRALDRDRIAQSREGIWRWHELLPLREAQNRVTLAEGDTPLLAVGRLAEKLGIESLYLKDETRNPSGSFKDRGASVTLSKCREVGIPGVVLASSGNAVTSFSTYAARAGIPFYGFLRDETSQGQRVHTMIFGTRAYIVEGTMTDGSRLAQQLADERGLFHAVQPYNLYRIEGKKTLAYEIAEGLGWQAPDRILVPTAGGTNILALHKGFSELLALGWIDRMPALDVVQARDCAPIARAFHANEPMRVWERPNTRLTGLGHPSPKAGDAVVKIVRDTGGMAHLVDDESAIRATRLIARTEGVFLQPASAASIAVMLEAGPDGTRRLFGDQTVVAIGTGSGKAQIELLLSELGDPPRIAADLQSLTAAEAARS